MRRCKPLQRAADVWTLDVCGVTRSQTPIPALVHRDAYAPTTPRTRVLLVGGLSGRLEDVTLAYNVLEAYVEAGSVWARRWRWVRCRAVTLMGWPWV